MKTLSFYLPEKLEPFLTKRKRFKIVYGGRGSGKSMSVINLLLFFCAQEGRKILSMREYMTDLKLSSYSLINEQIEQIEIPGFQIKKKTIKHQSGGCFEFTGMATQKAPGIKSYFGFDIFDVEEAQFLSDNSIRILLPTPRKEDSEIWMVMNPGSSQDPVSKKFLNPFWSELLKNGYYEDERFLIIRMNYMDNAKFPDVLEQERLGSLKEDSRALYDHIWLGYFNDSVEDGLIMREWFDACVDAHVKLGFKAQGIKNLAHDPSDSGDPKAFVIRHGSIIKDAAEKNSGDIHEGCDWALDEAIRNQVDNFIFDGEGLGIGLKRQIQNALKGKRIKFYIFKGSEKVDFPLAPYEYDKNISVAQVKLNQDLFKNKRAQYYMQLRKRIYNTYRAIVHKEYQNPDEMISFSSDIKAIDKIRSELCTIPIKPNGNGFFDLYTKREMKNKFGLASPNIADAIMMSLKIPESEIDSFVMPQAAQPIKRGI